MKFPKRLRYRGKGEVLATIYKRPNGYRDNSPSFAVAITKAANKGSTARLAVVTKALRSKDENVRLRAAVWMLSYPTRKLPNQLVTHSLCFTYSR